MTVDQELGVDINLVARPTSSGARIGRAHPETASSFLARLGAVSDCSSHARVWEALKSDGCRNGVAVLDQVSGICPWIRWGVSRATSSGHRDQLLALEKRLATG